MLHLQIFFNVNLKISDFTGFSAGLLRAGNFCFAPLRLLFAGKAVQMKLDQKGLVEGSFAKVSSFFYKNAGRQDTVKYSKQAYPLPSTYYGEGRGAWAIWGVQVLLAGLFILPGLLCKSVAYCLSPEVRKAHQITKDKFTPEALYGSDNQTVETMLEARVRSGQKTSIVYLTSKDRIMTQKRLELIKQVNPEKAYLTEGTWTKEAGLQMTAVFPRRKQRQKWDLSALEDRIPKMNLPRTIVKGIDGAEKFPRPNLFRRGIKKHTILMHEPVVAAATPKKG